MKLRRIVHNLLLAYIIYKAKLISLGNHIKFRLISGIFILFLEYRRTATALIPNGSTVAGTSSSPRPLRIAAVFTSSTGQSSVTPSRKYDFEDDDESISPTPVPDSLFVKIALKEPPVPKEATKETLKPSLVKDQVKKTALSNNNHNSNNSSSNINGKELANSRLNYQHHQSPRNLTAAEYNAYDISSNVSISSRPEILRVLERPKVNQTQIRARTIVSQSAINDLINNPTTPSTSATRIWKNRRLEAEIAVPHGFQHNENSSPSSFNSLEKRSEKKTQAQLDVNATLVVSDFSETPETTEPEVAITTTTTEAEETTTISGATEEPTTEVSTTTTQFKRVTKVGVVKVGRRPTTTTTTAATTTTTEVISSSPPTTEAETLTEEESGLAVTTNKTTENEDNEVTKEPIVDLKVATTESTTTSSTTTTTTTSTTTTTTEAPSTTTMTSTTTTTTRQPETTSLKTSTDSVTERNEERTTSSSSTTISSTPTDVDVPQVSNDGPTLLVRIVFENTWHEVCTKLPDMQKTIAEMINNNTQR